MQVIGILYEVADTVELQNLTSYLPQTSKSYYLCRADKKIYEKNFSGQYVVSKDLDEYLSTKQYPVIQEDSKNNGVAQLEHKDIPENELTEIKNTIDYLSKHIYNVNFKVDEVIKILNPNILPSDIHTRYNPDEVINDNAKQHNEHVPEQISK